MNQVGGNLNRGISVFYEVIYLCTYSLGYLPGDKQLPPDDTEVVDELHEERRLGSMWMVRDAMDIRDRLAPRLKKVCDEFVGANRLLHEGGELTKEGMELYFHHLMDVISAFTSQSQRLADWTRQVERLHSRAQAMQKPPVPGREDYYSWADAAGKLEHLLEEAGKMDVSWAGMQKLAGDTLIELKRAGSSPSRIVREMFLEAAEKQWKDIVSIADSITNIMKAGIKI